MKSLKSNVNLRESHLCDDVYLMSLARDLHQIVGVTGLNDSLFLRILQGMYGKENLSQVHIKLQADLNAQGKEANSTSQ
jgi:hypothetical protein